MTDPYIQINGTKIEVFDNDLSAVKTLKQLSNSSKIITATRDLAAIGGDVSYTGLDFTPTSIMCLTAIDSVFTSSNGFVDSAKNMSCLYYISHGIPGVSNTFFIAAWIDESNYQSAVIKTFDANVGFTLTWSKTGSPTGTLNLMFLCFR